MLGGRSHPQRTARCVRIRVRWPTPQSPRTAHACLPCREGDGYVCGIRRLSLTPPCSSVDRPMPTLQKLAAAAVGGGNFMYTSTDSGETWTERLFDTIHQWRSIASSSDGTVRQGRMKGLTRLSPYPCVPVVSRGGGAVAFVRRLSLNAPLLDDRPTHQPTETRCRGWLWLRLHVDGLG